jgi:hypothetical protein
MTRQQLTELRWSPERAEKYIKDLGVIRGCNYVPAYCYSYIEMWQNYREETIKRELTYAKRIGINSLRIFMATCQWQTRKEETYANLDKFLTLASSMGFSIMMTLQPNRCVRPGSTPKLDNPFIIHFRPSVHDGGWDYENSYELQQDFSKWGELRDSVYNFVYETVSRYKDDSRIAIWDLYNEAAASCGEIVECVFEAGRNVNPQQPLTACWQAWDLSDVGTFHCYMQPGKTTAYESGMVSGLTFQQEIDRMVEMGRPILCTEFLARPFGNELANVLPIYAEKHIGWYLWGLCAGAAQYQFPWGWPEGSPEPKRWFHCLLYPDGTPFDATEIPLIQDFQYVD